MFERILLPLDGSPTAEAILGQVRRILKRRDSEVILLQANETPLSLSADFGALRAERRQLAELYVRGIEQALNAQGARARSLVRDGPAAEVILDTVAKEKISLVAMSTHGRTGLPRWVFGSVTEKVLRACQVPLLLTRSFRTDGGKTVPTTSEELVFRRILVPIDESDLSLAVVPSVAELAGLFEARVTLLNVIEHRVAEGVPVPQMKHAAETLIAAGLRVEPVLAKDGDAASEILETCRQQSADLIAMSTHGRSGISRWVLGSVTEKVLRAATVPMLVVRPKK